MGGFYTAVDGTGEEFTLRCKKKFRRQHISPVVGDEVAFTPAAARSMAGWRRFCPGTANVCGRRWRM